VGDESVLDAEVKKLRDTIEGIRILADTALRDWDVFRIVEAMKQIHAKAKEAQS
jgi:hypothetical protein